MMIGEFARRSRLPVSTLRYYDRIGLLAPAAVDPSSGYRCYSADQLPTAMLISRLRALGTPPDAITRVVTGGSPVTAVLHAERRRIEAQIDSANLRLRLLDELLAADPRDGHAVEVVALEAREVAALPFVLPVAALETGVTRTIVRLRTALRRGGHRRVGPWGATFPVDLAAEVSGFVLAPVDTVHPRDLDAAWLQGGPAVATTHHGTPATLPLAYHALFARLDELGARPAGPVIEEYPSLDGPDAGRRGIRVSVPCGAGS